ncbi:unnamed protein product [Protopolystoma xenopodis]|uniref:Uncharacterized protein n=1 Tax=Protopolystoma xenopodis TaxID=117903 RepID=A0A3S5A4W8_9PLAT|nr:unnamed protein product [Protopolystoma xenopodis]
MSVLGSQGKCDFQGSKCRIGTRGNVDDWLTNQAPILRCHGSTPAGGVSLITVSLLPLKIRLLYLLFTYFTRPLQPHLHYSGGYVPHSESVILIEAEPLSQAYGKTSLRPAN